MSNYGGYNGDPRHDMWVDSSYWINTGEYPYDSYDSRVHYEPLNRNPTRRERYKRKLAAIKMLESQIEAYREGIAKREKKLEKYEPGSKVRLRLLRRIDGMQEQIERRNATIEKIRKEADKLGRDLRLNLIGWIMISVIVAAVILLNVI